MTREEAKEILENWNLCHYTPSREAAEAVISALDPLEIISALRPVSREQVILCKDCMYWQGNNGGYPHPECRWGRDETPDEDDYCSFAERLEVNKNG